MIATDPPAARAAPSAATSACRVSGNAIRPAYRPRNAARLNAARAASLALALSGVAAVLQAGLLAIFPAPALAGARKAPVATVSAADVIAKAPASAWADIDPRDLMLIDLANGRRVTIWLASRLAPVHIANMRTIAAAGWWDDATIYRVQDNYVAQWGDVTEKKPLPPGINPTPPAEYEWPAKGHEIVRNPYIDAYAKVTGFTPDGWPVASDGKQQWLAHCYASVGAGRNLAPDTGNGAELYAVIGHAPRHLDRNIAVVGRVIDGIDAMSSLPRGTGGGLGLYTDPKSYVPIKRVRVASELPTAEQPHWQYLKPASRDFADYLDARANRAPPFFNVPANAADLCNLPVPVRAAEARK